MLCAISICYPLSVHSAAFCWRGHFIRRGCSATVPNSSPWIVLSKSWRLPRMLDTLATAQQVRPVPVVRAYACVNKQKHGTSVFFSADKRRKGHSVLVLCVIEILHELYNTQRMGLICVQFCSPTSCRVGLWEHAGHLHGSNMLRRRMRRPLCLWHSTDQQLWWDCWRELLSNLPLWQRGGNHHDSGLQMVQVVATLRPFAW